MKQHYWAFGLAILVGLIYIAPNIFFILSLGGDYEGIPMMQAPNEYSYLGRIREILDGHPAVGSFVFFEYKDQSPIAPPVGEMFYAVPSILLGISPQNIVIASRFVLLFILFLLVYFLIYDLTSSDRSSGRLNGIAGALLITLGYGLVDFHTVWSWISGNSTPGGFLVWSRPVNPILGAIFLISFLLFVWRMVKREGGRKTNIIGASVFLALMIGSYFFSWGMAVSVAAMLGIIYLFKKEYGVVKDFMTTAALGALLTSPYWYISWQASKSPWYEDSILRSGLFYTHYPLLNKLTLAILAVYSALVIFDFFKNRASYPDRGASIKERARNYFQDWHWFCLALILGSLWAYSQQILTGRTAWPYHFVQYSIPLAIIVLMVLLYNIIRKRSPYLWRVGVLIVMFSSLLYGVYVQAGAYGATYEYYRGLQSYAPLFGELNKKDKDCVVLVREDGPESKMLNVMIPAFTHCNRYSSNEAPSLMPSERLLHNYLTVLRLKEVPPDNIEEYLRKNLREARGYLFSNWLGIYVYPAQDFPDFSDPLLGQRLKEFPEDYRQFVARDFKDELNKYRLDYILSVGPLPENVIDQLDGIKFIFDSNNIFLYGFVVN